MNTKTQSHIYHPQSGLGHSVYSTYKYWAIILTKNTNFWVLSSQDKITALLLLDNVPVNASEDIFFKHGDWSGYSCIIAAATSGGRSKFYDHVFSKSVHFTDPLI